MSVIYKRDITLVYIFNTNFPNKKAHSIQMAKVLFSLKKYFNIYCIVNRLEIPSLGNSIIYNMSKKDCALLNNKILSQYNYDLKTIHFMQIPKKKLVGLNFYYTIYSLNKMLPKNSIFYTRSYNLARRLIKTKFIHRKKVILESHKKDGYYKEEQIKTDTQYLRYRKEYEKDNLKPEKLKKIYRQADLVLFTSKNSEKIVKKDLSSINSASIWYPLDPKYDFQPEKRPSQIVYVGSLAPSKLIDLLLDALSMSNKPIGIDIYGGSQLEHKELIKKARKKEIVAKINCHDFIPYSQLHTVLKNYKYGVAMVEGIKVVDYLECGVIPIIPRIATYTDIFPEDTVIYFQPDNPQDLASALIRVESFNINIEKLKAIREFYFLDNFGQRLASYILSVVS
ncbi:MAG: glycosyltransferase [Desulfonauticus sp.]|nr:glycosyltransferase [Desulfonauticus sp.]